MRWTLSSRLYAALGVAALIMAISVGFTFRQVTTLAQLEHESEASSDILRKADLILFNQTWSVASLRGLAMDPSARFAASLEESVAQEALLFANLEERLASDPPSLQRLGAWKITFERWLRAARIAVDHPGRDDARNQILSFSIKNQLLPAFDAFITLERDRAFQRQAQAAAARRATQRYALLGAFIAMATGGALIAWTIRGVKDRISEALASASSATSEISTSLIQQERSLAEQASAINEVATTTAELNGTTLQASQNGESISRRATEASATARQMGEVMTSRLQEMNSLKDQVDAVAMQILGLSEQTSQIGSILTSVSDIASQTNLLALNAAVEAARAGEHGRGFAVVAAEIRKLADQSKKALERIAALVGQIQKATNATVMTAEEGGKRVEVTLHQVSELSGAIHSMLNALDETVLNTQQIVLNLRQQTLGVGQINEAVGSINQGMRETVTGINQVKTGLQNLGDMALHLRTMM